MSAVAFLLTFFAVEKSQSQRSEKNVLSIKLIIPPPEFQCDPYKNSYFQCIVQTSISLRKSPDSLITF